MEPRTAAARLEAWYARHGRDLPWRRTHDPYRVLVAEFILQQTRMETGLRYYASFLRRFPSLRALAAARPDDVLRQWSGLGYYARARNLHAAAREIQRRHGGRVPSDPDDLRRLAGVGPYTAGAVASIAFDRPEPALDGNQIRVLGRLLGRGDASPGVRRRLEAWARRLLAHASPRRLNQALMDLGSLVCLPRAPRCHECPLARGCRGRRRVATGKAPRSAAAPPSTERWSVLLHRRGSRLWLRRHPGPGPLSGLWLPPMRRLGRAARIPDLVHRFSHRRWEVYLREASAPPRGRGRWVRAEDLDRLPHSRLTRRVVAAARLQAFSRR